MAVVVMEICGNEDGKSTRSGSHCGRDVRIAWNCESYRRTSTALVVLMMAVLVATMLALCSLKTWSCGAWFLLSES